MLMSLGFVLATIRSHKRVCKTRGWPDLIYALGKFDLQGMNFREQKSMQGVEEVYTPDTVKIPTVLLQCCTSLVNVSSWKRLYMIIVSRKRQRGCITLCYILVLIAVAKICTPSMTGHNKDFCQSWHHTKTYLLCINICLFPPQIW